MRNCAAGWKPNDLFAASNRKLEREESHDISDKNAHFSSFFHTKKLSPFMSGLPAVPTNFLSCSEKIGQILVPKTIQAQPPTGTGVYHETDQQMNAYLIDQP